MVGKIIYGKEIAERKRKEIEADVNRLKTLNIHPGLAVILVGDDPASAIYVHNKQKACKKIGIRSVLWKYPEHVTEKEIINKVIELNNDPSIHGILVQLPLPDHINEKKVIETISPLKDVDGFHPVNIGRMMTRQDAFLPCTPFGIIELLKAMNITIKGKHVVIIGRSNIVGKPAGQLFLNEDATVTYCHSKTNHLRFFTSQADILVSAVGKENLITSDYIKEGCVVIDVGMNRRDDGTLCGDVDFEKVKEKVSYITPVPGGVGPMTITMLLYNTVKAAKNLNSTIS